MDRILAQTLQRARETLLSLRNDEGIWRGHLSSSALSTATATCALELTSRARPDLEPALRPMVDRGLKWLAEHQNDDGGFGDTVASPSNVSTSVLAWVALGLKESFQGQGPAPERVEGWLRSEVGDLSARTISEVISARYGIDRTFSVPILTMCALGGRFGEGARAWRDIPSIPFELAALPRRFYDRLGLPMVSYALPALIAMGHVRHQRCPSRFWPWRGVRALLLGKTRRLLEEIQPRSGGFLEAAPLTSFVMMSLVGAEDAHHPVVDRGVSFLRETVREDGSWPIDTELATWVTTLAVGSLGERSEEGASIERWLLAQQYRDVHPYTLSPPGGWAWTPLTGGVPDADDTPGALLALRQMAGETPSPQVREAAVAGVNWLLGLQNRDGGIPTFCRGWGKLPFDRSSPDLTAHTLRAFDAWREELPVAMQSRVRESSGAAVRFLLADQRQDGSWVPLWFGNQAAPNQENPVYGTSRVLRVSPSSLGSLSVQGDFHDAWQRGFRWLLEAQNDDGGFGGAHGVASSIEETAMALEALASRDGETPETVLRHGAQYLIEKTEEGKSFEASPIGLYFAKLWYDEALYPLIFTVSALRRVRARLSCDVEVSTT